MDWHALSVLIRDQKQQHNPAAMLIHSLKLEHNRVVLRLPNVLPDDVIYEEDDLSLQNAQQAQNVCTSKMGKSMEKYPTPKIHSLKLENNRVVLRLRIALPDDVIYEEDDLALQKAQQAQNVR